MTREHQRQKRKVRHTCHRDPIAHRLAAPPPIPKTSPETTSRRHQGTPPSAIQPPQPAPGKSRAHAPVFRHQHPPNPGPSRNRSHRTPSEPRSPIPAQHPAKAGRLSIRTANRRPEPVRIPLPTTPAPPIQSCEAYHAATAGSTAAQTAPATTATRPGTPADPQPTPPMPTTQRPQMNQPPARNASPQTLASPDAPYPGNATADRPSTEPSLHPAASWPRIPMTQPNRH